MKEITINVVGVSSVGKTTVIREIQKALRSAGFKDVKFNENDNDYQAPNQALRVQALQESGVAITVNEVTVRRAEKNDLTCGSCKVKDKTVTRGPNPFAAEIYGDYSDRDMCAKCRHSAAEDI